jgi:hypothetical protein
MKAKLGNKKAQEELKKREGSYGDNLLQENKDRERSRFLLPKPGKVAVRDRIRLIDRPDGTDALGNFRIPELPRHPNGEYAVGGARRRRRTKRRKPKKSKKSKRTRRTRRQRR